MKKVDNSVILERLDNLIKQVDDGFSGVHRRQDTTNGKVIVNTEFRIRTEATITTIKWLLGFVGIGTIAAIAKLFNIIP